MYIGVFGDSFAAPRPEPAWTARLAENYNVENYALSGSGVFYSYQMYKENAHKPYDKILFFASQTDRLWAHPDWWSYLPFSPMDHHFTGTPNTTVEKTAEDYPNHSGKSLELWNNMTRTAADTLTYFSHNHILKHYLMNLILSDVYKDERCLVIRCFRDTDSTEFCHNDLPLSDNFSDDWKFETVKEQQALHNHLHNDNHPWFYDKIEKWINTGEFSLTEDDLNDKIF